MYAEVTMLAELIEDPVYDQTKAGYGYAILRVVVERPWKKRGKRTYYSLFCYGEQLREVRAKACVGATIFCVGEHRADFDTGGPQTRMGDREMLATYDIAARVLSVVDGLGYPEGGGRQGIKQDTDKAYPVSMSL